MTFPFKRKFLFWGKDKSNEREIQSDDWVYQTEYRHPSTPLDDDFDSELAPGDDYLYAVAEEMKNEKQEEEEEEEEEEHIIEHDDEAIDICRRTSDHRLTFPNCNILHEIPLLDSQIHYLGYVCYRVC